ncbi:ATP-binding protein [Methyloligella sp. 2.7D]|uniref:ATP-binding protein n=1 Tax=unclassified Methyloligella TaxID=2625955 RepID=UPI00157C66AF|nr:ATP-binding protein [Methyloligella sp. GL2]QKP78075.1 hypothetical protein HT051_11870 [Methyloligella sp. GL2]
MLRKLWYNTTIRTQLLVAIAAINLGALLIAGVVTVYNGRKATEVEVSASLELAKQFVQATIRTLEPDGRYTELSRKISQLSERLQLAHLRHVRIYVADAAGNLDPVSPEPNGTAAEDEPPAPGWFTALVTPRIEARRLNVVQADPASGRLLMLEEPADQASKVWGLGTVVIQGQPADEIAEVWQDLSSLMLLWFVLDVAILVILYVLLGRMLDPLASVARGLSQLDHGKYATRLTPPKIQELAAITERFNVLAESLGRARAENAQLYEQLLTVQEDERREIASELHDEASPCLFGIAANGFSIAQMTQGRKDKRSVEIAGHIGEILKITDHLKALNRMLMKKLRPVAIGKIPIGDVITDLINDLARRYPEVEIDGKVATRTDSYGEKMDLAIYRCVQEGVTNAIRHGKADLVRVALSEKRRSRSGAGEIRPRTLQLTVQDDGRGISADTPLGFGMTVMRERIHALHGSCAIQSTPSQGATLRVIIPLEPIETQSEAALGALEARP